ncbi:flavin reductase family protein [Mesorhizobium sp. M0800]
MNVLRADQMAIADRFAGRGGLKGSARYEGARWFSLVTGALALDEALASVDCTVEDTVIRHSHALILGSIRHVVSGEPGPALILSSRRIRIVVNAFRFLVLGGAVKVQTFK